MKTLCRIAVAALLTCVCMAEERPGLTNAFFAMETGIHGSPASVARTLQELGYAGIGGGNYNSVLIDQLEQRHLRFFNAYLTLNLDPSQSALTPATKAIIDGMHGHHAALWLAIAKVSTNNVSLPRATDASDHAVCEKIRELADYARSQGVEISLYPHTGFWIETVGDAVRIAKKVDRPGVGATFNLCHFLKVEGDRDPQPALAAALPYLTFVSINGAESGDTKSMGWDRLIQTLDRGSYDAGGFLRKLDRVGYRGPIGFQGYGIKGDERDNLTRTMTAWNRLKAAAAEVK